MYSSMTVPNLKEELRKRNAALTEKKSDLIARFEDYNKNFGVTHGDTHVNKDSIVTPADDAYKDINANTELPPFTRQHIQGFIERYNKTLKIEANV